MDYKELIEQLRGLLPQKVDYAEMVGAEAVHYGKSFVYEDPESYLIELAADAIETLLAEREAVVNELREVADCTSCKFFNGEHTECDECDEFLDKWQWRGPTSHDQEKTES